MRDIIDRLRNDEPKFRLNSDAAHEIERLRADLADCRRLLGKYGDTAQELRVACDEKQRCIDSSVAAQREFLAVIDRLRAELAEIAAALSDDRYVGSKDWRDSNVLGRIECLHVMYASASAEAELWLAHLTDAGGQINRLRAELTEARRDAGRYRRLCSLVAWGTLGVCCVAEAGDDYADDGVMLDAWLDDPEMIAEVQGIDAAMAGGAK